jgi:DNA-binding NarL/FixJ family response regulator
MNKRMWAVLLVVVAILAAVPHLPTWYPQLRAMLTGFSMPPLLPAITAAARLSSEWLAAHWRIAGVVLASSFSVSVVALAMRARRTGRRTAQADILIMPVSTTVHPSAPTSALELVVSTRRPPGVMQPFERESRHAMIVDLFAGGRSVAEIARVTGIGQDAIRAAVRELRTA